MMLNEVKYSVSLRLTKVVVDPLAAQRLGFDLALGDLLIAYTSTSFHAQLPPGHTDTRDFKVTRMTPGTCALAPLADPATVQVGADGVLAFSAAVGPALSTPSSWPKGAFREQCL